MTDLHSWPTPNGHKVQIMLEANTRLGERNIMFGKKQYQQRCPRLRSRR